MPFANLLFESIPFCLFRVTILLPRIAMLAARPPLLITRSLLLTTSIAVRARPTLATRGLAIEWTLRSLGARTFPATLAATEAGVARGIPGGKQLPAFEPLHHRRRILS